MKKTFTLLSILWIIIQAIPLNNVLAQDCCPEFTLQDAVEICPPEGTCHSDPVGGQDGKGLAACNESTHTYTVFPNEPAFTYIWTVTGGTPATFNGNPNTITWGTGASGFIKVIISDTAVGGNCIDSIMQPICLMEGPMADFTLWPDTVCQNIPVNITNTSQGGSTYTWDFGDGTTYTGAAPPPYSYSSPGTYTITLTAQDMGAGEWVFSQEPPIDEKVPCGCIDTISKVVVVLPGEGPVIETDCCYGTVCPGDSSYFCTPDTCTTYDWSITGGTYIGDSTGNCIQVKWNATYSGPTTVSLELPGCGSAPCPGISTIDVPVLYPDLPINGPIILCVGSSGSYSLPSLPGTYYNWTSDGPWSTFNKVDRNSANVNITFMAEGIYWVKCEYDNPLAGCSGVDSLMVDVRPEFTIFGNDVVCEGSTTTYFGSGAANWAVSPSGPTITGNGTGTIDVSWTSLGSYTITAVPINPSAYCNTSAFLNVDVKPKPILNSILGPDSICPGSNFTYAISSNTSDAPFVWDITGGTGNILSEMGADKDSIVVNWTGIGPWQLSVYQLVILPSGDTCASLTETLNVDPFLPPSIVFGETNVCVDAMETYIASGSDTGDLTWSISPVGRGTIKSGQGTNTVSILWHGTPTTAALTITSCAGMDTYYVTISNPPVKPTITPNGPVEYCLPDMPNNLMLSVPGGYASYQWYDSTGAIGGATSNSYTIPNAYFPGAGGYIFTVVVSNGICTVSSNIVILIGDCGSGGGGPPNPYACDIDFTWYPNPSCANEEVTFTAIPTISGFQYAWDFGDGATSFTAPTSHIYTSTGTYSVTLTATLGNVCIVDTTKTITVNPLPICTISAPDTIFCPGDSLLLTACPGMDSYQWYKDGNPISGANDSTYNAYQHGEYWAEVLHNGCYNLSDSLYIYMHSLPKAKISGNRKFCNPVSSVAQVFMSTVYDPNYAYNWSSIPGGATFVPSNDYYTTANVTLPAVLPAVYEFVVDVTDLTTGCRNSDTICVYFYETPPLSVPYINACEGTPFTLTPTPNDTNLYGYQWNNGANTPVITVSTPGYYSLTITDLENGCSATEGAGFIHPKPDLSLFPLGCDNVCADDTFNLYIPLPIEQYGSYPSDYFSINWYQDGNYGTPIGSGENLAYTGGSVGNHQISVIVQNKFFCTDTAGVFCLSVDTVVNFAVSAETTCGCDTTLSFSIVDTSNGNVIGVFEMDDCIQDFSLCLDVEKTYDLVASNGIIISNAIIKGFVSYPDPTLPFLIGDNALCCFAAADSSFIKITTSVTYYTDKVWDNKYYLDDNVIVTMAGGSVLDITNVDVVFGECAGIVFQDSSYLRSTNSVYRPCNIDKTWTGIRFTSRGEFDNIIYTSTFKNAEVALYFQQGSDGVISGNLFSNCNYGVRIEGNNNFNHPISNNHFVTEQFFPSWDCITKYSFVNNQSTYGIYSMSSRLLEQVSQNEFINSWGNSFPRTFGIYQQNGGGEFTENTFTDLTYSIFINSAMFPTNIENNDVEVNIPAITSGVPIYINNSEYPVIQINHNNIANNNNQYLSFAGIYTRSASNVSMVNNNIYGFKYGIVAIYARNFHIANNEIQECNTTGIYFFSPPNDNTPNYIVCNNIRMRNYNGTRGIYAFNLSSVSQVTSNCITDCYTSMNFRSLTGNTPLPLIRNNFLYNYNYIGINVQDHTGNIGTITDPGMNTLYSNDNSAVDINSTSNITVADNFGMFNISWPMVQITSNNPYHSTASCATQIFNMPSQGNLNTAYTCDYLAKLIGPTIVSGDKYLLRDDHEEFLTSTNNMFLYTSLILGSVDDIDENWLSEWLSSNELSENERSLLQYSYYYRNSNIELARLNLNNFDPANKDEADYKNLRLIDLDFIENGLNYNNETNIPIFEEIIEGGSENANFAISLLNNSVEYKDYLIDELDESEVTKSGDTKFIGENNSYLNIYPNPANHKVYIELVYNNGDIGQLEIFDAEGRLITNYSVNIIAGGIELDIQELKNGFYFVTLSDPESGLLQKGKLVKMQK